MLCGIIKTTLQQVSFKPIRGMYKLDVYKVIEIKKIKLKIQKYYKYS